MKKYLTTLCLVGAVSIASASPYKLTKMPSPAIKLQVIKTTLALPKTAIKATGYSKDRWGLYDVRLQLSKSAAKQLGKISANNVGKALNLIVDGHLINTATIQSELNTHFEILGLTEDQARHIIAALKS